MNTVTDEERIGASSIRADVADARWLLALVERQRLELAETQDRLGVIDDLYTMIELTERRAERAEAHVKALREALLGLPVYSGYGYEKMCFCDTADPDEPESMHNDGCRTARQALAASAQSAPTAAEPKEGHDG